jgi:hypothetical protein
LATSAHAADAADAARDERQAACDRGERRGGKAAVRDGLHHQRRRDGGGEGESGGDPAAGLK